MGKGDASPFKGCKKGCKGGTNTSIEVWIFFQKFARLWFLNTPLLTCLKTWEIINEDGRSSEEKLCIKKQKKYEKSLINKMPKVSALFTLRFWKMNSFVYSSWGDIQFANKINVNSPFKEALAVNGLRYLLSISTPPDIYVLHIEFVLFFLPYRDM